LWSEKKEKIHLPSYACGNLLMPLMYAQRWLCSGVGGQIRAEEERGAAAELVGWRAAASAERNVGGNRRKRQRRPVGLAAARLGCRCLHHTLAALASLFRSLLHSTQRAGVVVLVRRRERALSRPNCGGPVLKSEFCAESFARSGCAPAKVTCDRDLHLATLCYTDWICSRQPLARILCKPTFPHQTTASSR
jgi:hypothetical protein